MAAPSLEVRVSGAGRVDAMRDGWRLSIPPGDASRYQLAQLDDYAGRRRQDFPWMAPLVLSCEMRASSNSLPGTWGIGLWNDPFGFGCSPTLRGSRLPSLPQAVWFFSASPSSYLSIRDAKPASAFYAQVLSSLPAGWWMVPAALTFPFMRARSRRVLGRHIVEDSAPADIDPRVWHSYELRVDVRQCHFAIDGTTILDTPASPRPPLGLVIWIDNQYAAFPPSGRLRWGLEASTRAAWLEVRNLECRSIT